MHATWERGRWRWEKWEIEPVRISLTTLFRPFLSRLDSTVKTVNTSVSYNHSQVSRASISRDANSLCECVEIYVFEFVIRFFRLYFLVSPDEATTRNTSAVRKLRLRISHSTIQSAAGFIVIKGGGKFFPLLGRLCSGRFYIVTEQMWL